MGLRGLNIEGEGRDVPAGWESGLAPSSTLDGVEGLDLCGRRVGSVMGRCGFDVVGGFGGAGG